MRAGVGVLARQRVPVGDEIEAVVLVLQRRPVLERADEVAEVELARRAHARHDSRLRHQQQAAHSRARPAIGSTIVAEHAGEHQPVEDEECRTAAGGRTRRRPDRAAARQHVAAVERRHRHHVEHRQQHVELTNARTDLASEPVRDLERRTPDTTHSSSAGDHRQHQVAGRPGRRNQHELLPPVAAQVPDVDRHRLRPADERQVRDHRDQRKQDRADRIDVHGRIERHAAEQSRRRIAQPVRRPRVRRFVHREGNNEEQ